MSSYRLQRSKHKFESRGPAELSLQKGDTIRVWKDDKGQWPNMDNWVKGMNERTKLTGEFPGNYTVFIEEVDVLPPLPTKLPEFNVPAVPARPPHTLGTHSDPQPPPVSPRHSTIFSPPVTQRPQMPPPSPGAQAHNVRHQQMPPSPVTKAHNMVEQECNRPVQCKACKDYIWGQGSKSFFCLECYQVCHIVCRQLMAGVPCEEVEAEEDDKSYTQVVSSYEEWSIDDVKLWMEACNIDVYSDLFHKNNITGFHLKSLNDTTLESMGIVDSYHVDVITECLDELCRGSSTTIKPSTSMVEIDGRGGDGTAGKRLSKAFSSSAVSKFFAGVKASGGMEVCGHKFATHSYTAPTWCYSCNKFLWGLRRQGVHCKACNMNLHRMCVNLDITACDMYKKKSSSIQMQKGSFGKDLSSMVTGDVKAPAVVLKCIEVIETRGLTNEGIFRVSPSHNQRKLLKEALDKEGANLNIHDPQWADVNLFAGCLKMFFHELPEPLFTYVLYNNFIEAAKAGSEEAIQREVLKLLDKLPAVNRSTLEVLIEHLTCVQEYEQQNKMGFYNLAVVFGPSLVRPKPDDIMQMVANAEFHNRIIDLLLRKRKQEKAAMQVVHQNEIEVEPPVSSTSVSGGVFSTAEKRVEDCGWYWGDISRDKVTAKLKDTSDGTFLVRKSQNSSGYTLTVRIGGSNRLIRIVYGNGKYGFSEPYTFLSVIELIDYYHTVSLGKYNQRVNTQLLYPISRFVEEEESTSKETTLQELIEVNIQFVEKNKTYQQMEEDYTEATKQICDIRRNIAAHESVIDLLREQADLLERHIQGGVRDGKEKTRVMQNQGTLTEKLKAANDQWSQANMMLTKVNINFRDIDREVNTMRPDIMQLQKEKEHLMDVLQRMGLTKQEITDRIGQESYTETEDIYGEIYGNMDTLDDEEAGGNSDEDPFTSSTSSFSNSVSVPRPPLRTQSSSRPLPPVPATQPPTIPRNRPPSIAGGSSPFHRSDSDPFGPGKQAKGQTNTDLFSNQNNWFVDTGRDGSADRLKGAKDGSFLVRPTKKAKVENHVYTVDIKYQDIKHLKVFKINGKFGFADPCEFDSLTSMIVHYSKNQLTKHSPLLTTTLKYPIESSSSHH